MSFSQILPVSHHVLITQAFDLQIVGAVPPNPATILSSYSMFNPTTLTQFFSLVLTSPSIDNISHPINQGKYRACEKDTFSLGEN